MPNLPNPFDSGACHVPPTPEKAAASSPQMPSGDAAAEIPDGSALLDCRAASQCLSGNLESDLSGTELIGEIFAGARKLFDPDPAAYTREDELLYDVLRAMDDPYAADLIEIPDGMWGEFDEPPLFIQQQMRG